MERKRYPCGWSCWKGSGYVGSSRWVAGETEGTSLFAFNNQHAVFLLCQVLLCKCQELRSSIQINSRHLVYSSCFPSKTHDLYPRVGQPNMNRSVSQFFLSPFSLPDVVSVIEHGKPLHKHVLQDQPSTFYRFYVNTLVNPPQSTWDQPLGPSQDTYRARYKTLFIV